MSRVKIHYLFFFVLILCIATLIGYLTQPRFQLWSEAQIKVGDSPLTVHVAANGAARSQGLSGRVSLGNEEGALFLFPTADRYGFWMKDMKFPLDIIWVGDNGRVAAVSTNLTPDTYPTIFSAPVPVRQVIEVNSGWVIAHQVSPGVLVTINDPLPSAE